MRCGQFAGRIDDLHPHRDERTVAHRGQELAALRWTALALQDPAEVGNPVEGHDEDLLGRLGPVFAPIPGRHADLLPVGGPVACTVVACRVHERLAEHRPAAVALLPRPRKPAHRHRKGPGGEIVDPDPGEGAHTCGFRGTCHPLFGREDHRGEDAGSKPVDDALIAAL